MQYRRLLPSSQEVRYLLEMALPKLIVEKITTLSEVYKIQDEEEIESAKLLLNQYNNQIFSTKNLLTELVKISGKLANPSVMKNYLENLQRILTRTIEELTTLQLQAAQFTNQIPAETDETALQGLRVSLKDKSRSLVKALNSKINPLLNLPKTEEILREIDMNDPADIVSSSINRQYI